MRLMRGIFVNVVIGAAVCVPFLSASSTGSLTLRGEVQDYMSVNIAEIEQVSHPLTYVDSSFVSTSYDGVQIVAYQDVNIYTNEPVLTVSIETL